jgi:hypothetical protein
MYKSLRRKYDHSLLFKVEIWCMSSYNFRASFLGIEQNYSSEHLHEEAEEKHAKAHDRESPGR